MTNCHCPKPPSRNSSPRCYPRTSPAPRTRAICSSSAVSSSSICSPQNPTRSAKRTPKKPSLPNTFSKPYRTSASSRSPKKSRASFPNTRPRRRTANAKQPAWNNPASLKKSCSDNRNSSLLPARPASKRQIKALPLLFFLQIFPHLCLPSSNSASDMSYSTLYFYV